ncbi:sensor histidine kinase [Nonomuraea sp. NPDC049625]|uniref:sensor histidine kinase n=1 Tax=Nonomuraea sp. NPDC049625 TaxID=3155775 RepID=UPI003412B511
MAPREFDRGRRAVRAGALAWLLVLGWPLWSLLESEPRAGRVVWAFGAVAVFAACWVTVMWRMFSGRRSLLPAVAGLIVATLALLPVLGPPWAYVSFVFVVSALATSLEGVAFAVATAVTAGVEVVALMVQGVSFGGIWWVPVAVAAQAAAVDSIKRMGVLLARLDAAHAQVAQLAVENERLRFARDLHDILGHTLTSIIIRSQLAARLTRTDPDRAAREMTDMEQVARQALDEVRLAVAGYRAPALSEELDKAARELRLAGIELKVSPADGPIPAATETLLAWAVREAATNVLRHSRARHCWIGLRVDAGTASVEVYDDGPPVGGVRAGIATGEQAIDTVVTGPGADRAEPCGRRAGSGLTGLAERVAEAGGLLEVGRPASGGYRLYARVPLADAS